MEKTLTLVSCLLYDLTDEREIQCQVRCTIFSIIFILLPNIARTMEGSTDGYARMHASGSDRMHNFEIEKKTFFSGLKKSGT